MEKAAIKDLVYGGIEEIINNRRYFYASSISRDYCHFTDEGKAAILEYMSLMAYQINKTEQEDLNQRAKQQVLDTLKAKD